MPDKKDFPMIRLTQLAFQYFEQSKSRTIADALIQTERTHKLAMKDSLLRVHAELKRQLFTVQDALNTEMDEGEKF